MQHAFIDESGNTSLTFEGAGTSTFFVLVAVLVKGESLKLATEKAEQLRAREFQTGEMKSSSIAASDRRRIRILSKIGELPLTFFAMVVDKRAVKKEIGRAHV